MIPRPFSFQRVRPIHAEPAPGYFSRLTEYKSSISTPAYAVDVGLDVNFRIPELLESLFLLPLSGGKGHRCCIGRLLPILVTSSEYQIDDCHDLTANRANAGGPNRASGVSRKMEPASVLALRNEQTTRLMTGGCLPPRKERFQDDYCRLYKELREATPGEIARQAERGTVATVVRPYLEGLTANG
ncbi:hypothetical protein [Rhizobium tubonense]|uniref:hypothetical protein n=1 Tax=Rhizobium tubonense TaxID=484088 RepID=UPI001FCEE085|nr:hypothetical protein [Rhizobium tubonense]